MIEEIVEALAARHGMPAPPLVTDPFQQIVWETVCYLVDDDRRGAAFEELRSRVGLEPSQIVAAPLELLREIACGIAPQARAERLHEVARIALDEYDGRLGQVLKLPSAAATKALTRFPGIGKPGAEKILMFAGASTRLALESNGLRVLLRLGVAREGKSYAASYRAVQEALAAETPGDSAWCVTAHRLLRQHGKETCRRSAPECGACPLRDRCDHFTAGRRAP